LTAGRRFLKVRHPHELQLYAVQPAQVAELVDALASGASGAT